MKIEWKNIRAEFHLLCSTNSKYSNNEANAKLKCAESFSALFKIASGEL